MSITSVNSDTILDVGYNIYLIDASANDITLTLPSIYGDGITLHLKE